MIFTFLAVIEKNTENLTKLPRFENFSLEKVPDVPDHSELSALMKNFSCKDKCHELATCSWPGFCHCPPGYEGDGVNMCRVPQPYSYKVELIKLENNKQIVNVTYTGVSISFKVEKVYCKIGDTITKAISYTYQHVVCDATNAKTGDEVSLAFEENNFGDPAVIGLSSDIGPFAFFGICLGVTIGISAFALLFKTKPGIIGKKEEIVPLCSDNNRTHPLIENTSE